MQLLSVHPKTGNKKKTLKTQKYNVNIYHSFFNQTILLKNNFISYVHYFIYRYQKRVSTHSIKLHEKFVIQFVYMTSTY